jgi:hypothetical protein
MKMILPMQRKCFGGLHQVGLLLLAPWLTEGFLLGAMLMSNPDQLQKLKENRPSQADLLNVKKQLRSSPSQLLLHSGPEQREVRLFGALVTEFDKRCAHSNS